MNSNEIDTDILVRENEELRKRINELEAAEAKHPKVERQFTEQLKLTQVFLNALPPVAMLLRPKTREIVACNRAGEEVGAITGKTCFETWGNSDRPCPWCKAEEVWKTGIAQHLQTWGVGRFWDAHWIPVDDDLYLHYAYDITD